MTTKLTAAELDAIVRAPEDDAPRRVVARRLTDVSDPRGRFITLQCTFERLGAEERTRSGNLFAEVAALRRQHEIEWFAAAGLTPAEGTCPWVHRGRAHR